MKKTGRFYPDLQKPWAPYAHSVRVGELLFISGMTARASDAASADIETQAEVVLRRIQHILEAEGATFKDLVRMTTYVAQPGGFKEVAEVRRRYFPHDDPDDLPASTMIGVTALVQGSPEENILVEMDAVALLPG